MTVTLPGLLRARAREQPSRPALSCDDSAPLSFGEWDERADATASALLGRGLTTGDRVGLLFENERWTDYAVTFLGVLRAGGVAVPLPARQSPATLQLMIDDCQARWILDQPLDPKAPEHPNVVPVGTNLGITQLDLGPNHPPGLVPASKGIQPVLRGALWGSREEPLVEPGDLAQILYTSGTTGRPKGVAASHANLAFGHRPHPAYRMLSHSEHFLHAFPIGTNAGQMMLVNTLVAHPAAVVASVFEAERFCALIAERRVGTVFLVPSMAVDLLNSGAWQRHDLSSVLLLSSSADALPPHVAVALPEAFPKATIVNFYTSTEAVPAQTTMIVDPGRPHSVGRATESGDLRITGEDGGTAGVREVGEVWLRAPAAQRSYYGDPQASERVFQRGWTRMGDLGYLDKDGYLYLIGRESDVIKSGGLKISTLQVEAAVREHPAVSDVAVLGVPHPVMGAMVAAAVVSQSPIGADELRTFLHQRLARNEIPTRYAFVDVLPRNELGKVVKGELRELFTVTRSAGGRPLETPGQQALARLWSGVLGLPVTSPDDDFFALGGDSLKASQLATRTAAEFGVEVPGTLAFDHPTLASQAEQLLIHTPTQDTTYPEMSPELGGLSGVQEHWWHWMHATPETRHMPPVHVAVQIDGTLDPTLLNLCLAELTRRHEALRTVFRAGQAITAPDSDIRVTLHEARDLPEAGRLAADLVRAPFDIGRGPLLRAALIRLPGGPKSDAAEPAAGGGLYRDCGPTGGTGSTTNTNPTEPSNSAGPTNGRGPANGRGLANGRGPANRDGGVRPTSGAESAVLVLAAHHMIFDGWSAGVLLRELGVLYSAFSHGAPSPLPPPTQYAEFVAFEHREWHRTRPHWTSTLAGAPSTLPHLPGRSPTVTLCAAISHDFTIPPVRDLATRHNATPAMVLAAAWATTLSAWSGSPEIVLATPVTGRSRPEFQATIGCLFRWNLLRVRLDDDTTDRAPNGEDPTRRDTASEASHESNDERVREGIHEGVPQSIREDGAGDIHERVPEDVPQGVRAGVPEGARDDVPRGVRAGVIAQVRQAALVANDHQFHSFARLHDLVPYPAYFRFESWGRPAHLPGLPSQEFVIPAGPVMEWRLADDDPDTHPPELLVTERPDGSLTGSMIFNKHAYRQQDMAELAEAFVGVLS
ncbi:hypothetical protein Acor_62960 [Acrocarpospora corrugata]|uniref:Carrier domain-containing protein n=1 Tax=Acrocarpospora corrugata TaxID=35763 RepID=A0A5M3WCR5_9ACTN|nr:AMP-binding protein [Acrocarpospora corrugata]GES04228.1 hypothetical protein Acor_62960 [Acrocarpospora corrugata]